MQAVLEMIEALTTEHDRLLDISMEKTELMKSGQIEAFQKLLMQERKQTQVISQLETRRVQAVDALFEKMGLKDTDKTVSELLAHMEEGREKRAMEAAVSRLIDYMVRIRDVEQLNMELIQQSMTFVQLSLEMLQPSLGQMNYGQGQQQAPHSTRNTSVFDSKA